jgi:predicted nuclease of restriction endonuclease-like (RecB) superfamily
MIDLYWSIGEHISRKVAADGWGQGTVEALAEYIRRRQPNARGFSASNLWRMTQFYEAYRGQPKLATLLRELSWSHNLDTYLFEFLGLPPGHSEADLQRGLVEKLKQFLVELGRDFCFVGGYYPLQVGGRDFEIDLLFFNRAPNSCSKKPTEAALPPVPQEEL